ncbi:carboxylesterase/lipase family protein [Mucilaginibacter sp. OK098]|uniref:carboxylesterase/lipase family protein n=1 Tax=Mucilaginibacter sp. OK098 TaxID=1855297 RepID=UPI00091417B8|nr:carboxylesterase family protein [Mucilaginibacter sp. OK098]SHM19807.1 para-nitrobenzyl esterase [Mucilaginibacter sp. OK098]
MRIFPKSLLLLPLVCAAVTSFTLFQPAANDLAVVQTKSGLISGTTNATGDVHIFKGVPFAAPPVGELRWREPQPVAPWSGIRKCDRFGPNAMQRKPVPADAYGEEILIPEDLKISEDCLYLNVWTPAKQPGEKRPVIVVVHGGSFTAGSGAVPILDGEQTAKKGVVVVTINYRLGIFGFLAHPALSGESPHHASGNYGILDQIAAFKWIKQNIAAFGGDPQNITANGGSAGSCGVLTMIASPLSKGLFRRAISESGPLFKPNHCLTLRQAEAEGLKTMNEKNADDLSAMRAIPAETLLKGDYMRLPVVDGYVLSDQILAIFTREKQNDVDLLIGYNTGDDDLETAPLTAAAFTAAAQKRYGQKAEIFLKRYPAHTDDQAAQSQLFLTRDSVFALENYIWAKCQISHGKCRAWFYYFSHAAPGKPNYGAFHGSQTAYALHNLYKWNKPFTDWDRFLSNAMNGYWINFAVTGNPNAKDLPNWPAFTIKHTRVLQLGERITAIPLPALPAFEFFKN